MSNTMNFDTMRQYAPYPRELLDVVTSTTFPPEVERVYLSDMERDSASTHGASAGGLTLCMLVASPDAYHQRQRRVMHLFPVPAATFNRDAWVRWLFDRVTDMRMHELMEYFTVEGQQPFAPLHGPGDNPYVVHVASTDVQRRTSYLGEVKSPENK